MRNTSGNNRFRSSRRKDLGFRLLSLWTALSVFSANLSTVSAQSPVTTQQPAAPQPTALRAAGVPLEVALDTRGDLSLQGATIEKALITVGASWGVNIVVGKDVQGTVSCIYKQTPLREVLDAILLANGYSYRAVGDSLVVQRRQDVGSANPLYESAAISITHSDLNEILEGARLLLSKEGQIRALESAKSILVVDYADRVASIRDFVSRMDAAASQQTGGIPAETFQRLQVMYFPIQYIPVESAREPLTAVLSSVGRVATMPAENRLVVVDYASNLAMVRRVLERIDRPVPQVRITALIYDISLQDMEELGLNWQHDAGNPGSAGILTSGNSIMKVPGGVLPQTTPSAVGSIPVGSVPGADFVLGNLSERFSFSVIGSFLQNANDARLLANPNVTVMENETAEMGSVQEIPFQQLTQSELGGQIGTTSFKEVGIKLNVTPTIAADGTVKLVMQQEFSTVVSRPEEGPPTVDTRTANTTVRVRNGHTLVIGGLRQRSDTGDFNGVPFLKDVKYIGPLFRSRNTIVRESELVVFLKPEIVSYHQQPSGREAAAAETVNCRLDRVPVAEGCGGPGGNNDACTAPYDGQIIVEDFDAGSVNNLPPAFQQPLPPQSNNTKSSIEKTPLRPSFDNRYRAKSGTAGNRRMTRESNARVSSSVKSDSRALLERLRSQ